LPQAVNNYLATIGRSVAEELQSLDELVTGYNFENMHSTGPIKYDTEKLKWLNHKWIERLDNLIKYVRPFMERVFPEVIDLSDDELMYLINKVRTDAKTLKDFTKALGFYFKEPDTSGKELEERLGVEASQKALRMISEHLEHPIEEMNR